MTTTRKSALKKLSLFLRIAISGALIAALLIKVDWNELAGIFPSISWGYIMIAVVLLYTDKLLTSFRWSLLLKKKGLYPPFGRLVKIDFLSNALGVLIPSSAGPDVIRGYGLSRYSRNTTDSLSSLIIDRLISVTALVAITLAATGFLSSAIDYRITVTVWGGAIILGLMLLLITNRALLRIVKSIFGHRATEGIAGAARKIFNSFLDYRDHPFTMAQAFGLALLSQGIRIFRIFLYSLALGLDIPFYAFVVFVPIILFLTLLPISLAGIGIRENGYLYFFARWGITPQIALTISLFTYFMILLTAIPGAIIYLVEGIPKEEAGHGLEKESQQESLWPQVHNAKKEHL